MKTNIIEGYSYNDVTPDIKYRNRRDNRRRDRGNLYRELVNVTNQRNAEQTKYDEFLISSSKSNPSLIRERDNAKLRLNKLNIEIEEIKVKIANLEFDIKADKSETNKKYNNELIPNERKYALLNNETDEILDEILPLKKKENSEANNYYNLLQSQNNEVSSEMSNLKNNLTTADRKYIVNDSKIPYYVSLNRLLLFVYIAIAFYVGYRVLNGMITHNIYGKLIVFLIISLYPIYMFNIENTLHKGY